MARTKKQPAKTPGYNPAEDKFIWTNSLGNENGFQSARRFANEFRDGRKVEFLDGGSFFRLVNGTKVYRMQLVLAGWTVYETTLDGDKMKPFKAD